MEERSSKRPRPSGDWKPYKREEAQGEAEDKPKPSGDWKPYDRGAGGERKQAEQRAEQKPREEKKPRSEPREEPQPRAEQKGRSEPRAERKPDDEPRAERKPSEAEHSGHEPSTVDAMGQDKHREVIGQHGANRGRQILYYGIFVAFIVVAYLGLKTATDSLDKAPKSDPDQAPWSQPNAPGSPLGGFTPKTQDEKGPTDFQ